VVITILLSVVWFSEKDDNLEIYFFDIGQGDGMLIRTPDKQNIVIDGGPDNTFLSKLGQTLPFYDRTIDLMVLSHPHDDHLFGLVEVLRRYDVQQVLSSGVIHTTDAYLEFLELVKEKQVSLKIAQAGQTFIFGDLKLEVLYPLQNMSGEKVENLNNSSVVLRLSYQDQLTALLTGDLEIEGENELMAYHSDLKVDLLKAGHHGSDTSSQVEFLARTDPEYVVIQSGEGNKFGHPSGRVLKRLERLGSKVLRNDLLGDILFLVGNQGWEVKTSP